MQSRNATFTGKIPILKVFLGKQGKKRQKFADHNFFLLIFQCCEDAITDSCVCEPEIIETAPVSFSSANLFRQFNVTFFQCCHLKRKRRSTSNAKVVSREEDETPENDDDRY